MFKNVSSQKVTVFAFDYTTGAPKTGDSGNITVYVSKDDGSVTALTDTSATENDATNAKGSYTFDLSQAETNADKLVFSGKSSTLNVVIVQQTIYTLPASFTAFVTPTGAAVNVTQIGGASVSTSTAQLGVNVVNVGGTSQTAKDLGAINVTNLNTLSGHDPGETIMGATDALTITTNSDKTGYRLSSTGLDDILRTALTESYAADGAAGTLSQILFGVQAFLQERSVSGTTLTVKKLDGSTTAMTFTLDSGTTPTSITRS